MADGVAGPASRIAEARAPRLGEQMRCAKRRPRTGRSWVRALRRIQQVPQGSGYPLPRLPVAFLRL